MTNRAGLFCFMAAFSLIFLAGCDGIVNFMAFYPDKKDVIPAEKLPRHVKEIFIETPDNIKLQSYLVEKITSDKILIYFHGNAGNISHRLYDLIRISKAGINVLGISYRGYGKSQGRPDEDGLYIDGRAAVRYAEETLGFKKDKLFILGRSIGTTVAVVSARKQQIAGLILVSPLTSGKAQAKATGLGLISFIAGDSFNNLEKIPEIICPVMVIHGTEDSVIPFEMGAEIFNRVQTARQFVKIDGAGHNNLSTDYYDLYWTSVDKFIQSK